MWTKTVKIKAILYIGAGKKIVNNRITIDDSLILNVYKKDGAKSLKTKLIKAMTRAIGINNI